MPLSALPGIFLGLEESACFAAYENIAVKLFNRISPIRRIVSHTRRDGKFHELVLDFTY